jgi:hypothetical protein
MESSAGVKGALHGTPLAGQHIALYSAPAFEKNQFIFRLLNQNHGCVFEGRPMAHSAASLLCPEDRAFMEEVRLQRCA